MVIVSSKFKTRLQTIPPIYSQLSFPFYVFLGLSLWSFLCVFGKIAPMKYRINTKINPCNKVIFSFLRDCKTKLHDFLYATLLYATPGWDLIQSIFFINEKQFFPLHHFYKKIVRVSVGWGIHTLNGVQTTF